MPPSFLCRHSRRSFPRDFNGSRYEFFFFPHPFTGRLSLLPPRVSVLHNFSPCGQQVPSILKVKLDGAIPFFPRPATRPSGLRQYSKHLDLIDLNRWLSGSYGMTEFSFLREFPLPDRVFHLTLSFSCFFSSCSYVFSSLRPFISCRCRTLFFLQVYSFSPTLFLLCEHVSAFAGSSFHAVPSSFSFLKLRGRSTPLTFFLSSTPLSPSCRLPCFPRFPPRIRACTLLAHRTAGLFSPDALLESPHSSPRLNPPPLPAVFVLLTFFVRAWSFVGIFFFFCFFCLCLYCDFVYV